MTALIIILGVFAVLIILALMRFGAVLEYSEDGLAFQCVCGPVRIKLLPSSDNPKKGNKRKKKDKRKNNGKKTADRKAEDKKGGGAAKTVKAVLPTAIKTAGRFFKHLRIDELTIRFTITGDDPCDTAMNYGYISAGMGYIVPLINRSFKIKKWNVKVFPSFTDEGETVYIKAKTTIALWEIIYIIAKLDFKAIFSIL